MISTGTPGIGDVVDGVAVGNLSHRLVKLEAFRLDLLHERSVVLLAGVYWEV
jgi:hypothetical protein